jgi:hypothetical protein
MADAPVPQRPQAGTAPGEELRFATLLYRFLFFDWLFADMTRAMGLFERRLAWQHNRSMRRHLPTYFRRWSCLTALGFGLGSLFQLLEASLMAAWFFTLFSATLSGMVVISVAWVLLGRPAAK